MRYLPIAFAGALALAGCTAQQVADVSACAAVVQANLAAQPKDATNQAKAFAAEQAAAADPACVGVLMDVVNGVATVKPKSS